MAWITRIFRRSDVGVRENYSQICGCLNWNAGTISLNSGTRSTEIGHHVIDVLQIKHSHLILHIAVQEGAKNGPCDESHRPRTQQCTPLTTNSIHCAKKFEKWKRQRMGESGRVIQAHLSLCNKLCSNTRLHSYSSFMWPVIPWTWLHDALAKHMHRIANARSTRVENWKLNHYLIIIHRCHPSTKETHQTRQFWVKYETEWQMLLCRCISYQQNVARGRPCTVAAIQAVFLHHVSRSERHKLRDRARETEVNTIARQKHMLEIWCKQTMIQLVHKERHTSSAAHDEDRLRFFIALLRIVYIFHIHTFIYAVRTSPGRLTAQLSGSLNSISIFFQISWSRSGIDCRRWNRSINLDYSNTH